ncbi:MAG: sigma-54 dependent transcriptional regulator [Anaeromyxobacteraceae bacterium]|nr:sigma-54 dependent transcriptional regulator [Anaeromyxobacteraceae bacterium]
MIALEGESGAALGLVRALSARGVPVLAYAEGSGRWPVQARCLPLLAGARHLLDTAASSFLVDLRARLGPLLDAGRARSDEEQRVELTMSEVGFVGRSPAVLALFRAVVRIAPLSDLPVLVAGETGTGKELLARAIHRLDPKRSRGPFIPVNCAALTRSLAESELFGHRRGAFTGAERDRPGLVRTASGGILFLDEIAELDPDLQGKLLRVVQEQRVLGVGHDSEIAVDVRVVAATHRDLQERVRAGLFREDLFHRLSVVPVQVPPLRERTQDVALLVDHFLAKHRAASPFSLVAAQGFIEALSTLRLPGNVRELENLVRRAVTQKEGDSDLDLGDLPREALQQLTASGSSPGAADGAGPAPEPARSTLSDEATPFRAILEANGWKLTPSLQAVERLFLLQALERARGNQSETGRLLGLSARSVYTKIRRHRIELPG